MRQWSEEVACRPNWRSSWSIGRIAGFDVSLEASWAIVIPVLAWTLSGAYFARVYPVFAPATIWLLGLAGSILTCVSVLLRAVLHAHLRRRLGGSGSRIALRLSGNHHPSQKPESVLTEGVSALASLVGGIILSAVCFFGSLAAGSLARPLEALLGYLTLASVIQSAVQLIPIPPLDVGKLLVALLSDVPGLRDRTDLVASRLSLIGSLAFLVAVMWQLIEGGYLPALWIALFGFSLRAGTWLAWPRQPDTP